MTYKWIYKSPPEFDDIILNSDGTVLTGLGFLGSKDMAKYETDCEEKWIPIFEETVTWLDLYFSGREPDFTPQYKMDQLTPFRREVVEAMIKIPYGQTVAYGDIAKEIAKNRGIEKMSAQAVGGAVGWNPIGIIVPCHRVIGTNGKMTGYGGGLNNKIELLRLEKGEIN